MADLATSVFGEAIRPRINAERAWHQVYLSAAARLTHGHRNPVAAWVDDLGRLRPAVLREAGPAEVFRQPPAAIAFPPPPVGD